MELYVYGTGCGAGDLVDGGLSADRITAFVETEPHSATFLGRPVIPASELAARNYDLVIVTVRQAEAVAEHCKSLGIDPGRLFYLKNNCYPADRNTCYERAEAVLGKELVSALRTQNRMIRVPLWSATETEDDETDYVRFKTLEALCCRLEKVPGAAAELGVYRGEFARHINSLLPERKLYLFDTFCGFDPRESADQGEGFVTAHQNTSERLVLSRLPHPDNAVIRKGLFPHSARGLEEERFSLVSLDADLEESTFAGLCFFLPRLSEGGYLLLHDYNNPKLPGVRKAVARYEMLNSPLKAVPLCDVNGTLVICC